jgi:hypothetical protein
LSGQREELARYFERLADLLEEGRPPSEAASIAAVEFPEVSDGATVDGAFELLMGGGRPGEKLDGVLQDDSEAPLVMLQVILDAVEGGGRTGLEEGSVSGPEMLRVLARHYRTPIEVLNERVTEMVKAIGDRAGKMGRAGEDEPAAPD